MASLSLHRCKRNNSGQEQRRANGRASHRANGYSRNAITTHYQMSPVQKVQVGQMWSKKLSKYTTQQLVGIRCSVALQNIVIEESENGGEQEAAIPLTGGLVRSVMVRVQLFFTAFCRRGRHVFRSWSNSLERDKEADCFPSSFSLDRRPLMRRKVQRAQANNVLLCTQCSCRRARKSQQAPLTRSFHYERASPNGEGDELRLSK